MPNLSALSSITTTATTLSNLILVSPNAPAGYQPQNPPDANGNPSLDNFESPAFLFHYEGEQTATLESDITDHYIENNTAIQDNIALRPVLVTTQGYIGELNDVAPAALSVLKAAVDKLLVIDAYTPVISETALIAYNTAFQLYQVATNAANAAVSSWTSLTSVGNSSGLVFNNEGLVSEVVEEPVQNKQQVAFMQFYGWWSNRVLFSIQTPWALFQNMAIKTLRPIQSEETNVISTFECTFKQIRTVNYAIEPPQSDISQGRLSQQSSSLTNQGVSTPPSSISLDSGLSSNFPGMFA